MLGNSEIVVRNRGTRRSTIGIFRGIYGIIPPIEYLLLKNLTCRKIVPNSMQNHPKSPKHKVSFRLRPWQPRRDKRDSRNRPSKNVTGSQRYTLGLDTKRSKGKYQNF